MSVLLTGDIGGTNARFALARKSAGGLTLERFERIACVDGAALEDAIRAYLARAGATVDSAALAVAGPIIDGAVQLTNRPWRVSEAALRQMFGWRRVALVNDFAAMARGAVSLPDADGVDLIAGSALSDAPIIVAGPGTGFGAAIALPRGDGWRILPTEGGHQAFAPQTDFEWAIAQRLRAARGYVSVELACAGVGFDVLLQAVQDVLGAARAPASPQEIIARADAGDAVAQTVCAFRAATILSACGDLALSAGARGGVILAGGVAEYLLSYLKAPEALARFAMRGPMSRYLADTPVRVLTDPRAPLYGAAALSLEEEASAS
ncbi:MAG: ROK family protein [Alphaproteobacteria bacterium]|nr:ROK family protein [Alphaproteobacteria bacterium]